MVKTVVSRIGLDEYFLKLSFVVAERSTCRRHHVGAIVVRDKYLLATGYNGAPKGFDDCLKLGCLRDELHILSGKNRELCRAVHAEENVVAQASVHGASLVGSTIYCTHTPCTTCAKLLVNCGARRFVSCIEYDDDAYKAVFKLADIIVDILDSPLNVITMLK